jgi:hypothetical protein
MRNRRFSIARLANDNPAPRKIRNTVGQVRWLPRSQTTRKNLQIDPARGEGRCIDHITPADCACFIAMGLTILTNMLCTRFPGTIPGKYP